MRAPSRPIRRALLLGASAATAAAMIVPAVTSSASAQPGLAASTSPGYPPPGGIYAPFTNCPLKNPVMRESLSGDATGCVAGDIQGGSVTIGNITTPVKFPVTVQFGIWDPPNATFGGDNPGGIQQFAGGILPPLSGLSAMIATKPDPIPESLTTALGCPSSDATVENLCQQAQAKGGVYNQVSALAKEAGQLTNFGLFTWTQRVKFQLINPLLGSNCFIGSDNNPIVLNPQVTLGPGGQFVALPDPNPSIHPNTVVLGLIGAVATDNTFVAPGVTGCGPGGAANIAVDQALDAGTGLPAASGTSNFTFTGNLWLADCFASANQDSILLSAFQDSTSGGKSARRSITASDLPQFGIHPGS